MEEEKLELYDHSAIYKLFKSLYSHIYHSYRGKKGETEIGYRETCNSTTVTLVLVRARSKPPIHGTDILRPNPTDAARRTHRTQRSGWTRTRHPEFLSPHPYHFAIAATVLGSKSDTF